MCQTMEFFNDFFQWACSRMQREIQWNLVNFIQLADAITVYYNQHISSQICDRISTPDYYMVHNNRRILKYLNSISERGTLPRLSWLYKIYFFEYLYSFFVVEIAPSYHCCMTSQHHLYPMTSFFLFHSTQNQPPTIDLHLMESNQIMNPRNKTALLYSSIKK